MPDHLGEDMRKVKNEEEKEEKEIKCELYLSLTLLCHITISSYFLRLFFEFSALDEGDIALLKTYVSFIILKLLKEFYKIRYLETNTLIV